METQNMAQDPLFIIVILAMAAVAIILMIGIGGFGLTHTLRLEMRDSPIDVVLIQPGPITSHIRQNAIPHFEKWIDWRGSARAAFYERQLVKRLYEDVGPDKFELPASAVSDTLLRALSVKKPKANYYVTAPTYMASWMRRLLPQRALDYLLTRG